MQTVQEPKKASQRVPQSPLPALKQGQKLAGCYVLKSEKYVSGIASVWLAQDEVLGKDVCLHFIPHAIRSDEKAMDEMRSLTKRNRQLAHPSILRTYDFIEEKDWAAIATDAVEGDCVSELLRKRAAGFFEVADVKPWLAQLCQTLDDAHKVQLVHGDLSLDHLFVDKEGRLVVANFGIGRCVRDAVWRAAGPDGGTPPVENLSPQMLDGQAPSASDDIYATGILLHELLAGQRPFTGPDVPDKIRNSPAGKIMDRRTQLQKAGGPIPPTWEKAVAACLEKSVEQRPKNLADLSGRLALAKFDAKTEEPRETAAPIEAGVSAPKVTEEPVIPVVRKAWGGPKIVAPIQGGVNAPKPERDHRDTEVDLSDAAKPVGQEPALTNALPESGLPRERRRSGFPVTGVAAAIILAGLCVYAVVFGGFKKTDNADSDPIVRSGAANEPQYAPVTNPIPDADQEPVAAAQSPAEPVAVAKQTEEPPAAVTAVAEPEAEKPAAQPLINEVANQAVAETAPVEIPGPEIALAPKPEIDSALILAANTKVPKKGPVPVATPIPINAAPEAGPGASLSAKSAALEAARKSVEEWDKTHAEMLKRKEQAEGAIAQAKKALDEKMKSLAPMLKASDEITALRQKREADMRAAEAAAEEAKKAAEEKARLAEEAKKAVLNVDKDNKDKLAGQKKAEAELDELKKAVAENERLAAESAKFAEGAITKKEEQIAVVKQKEQDVALAMAAAEIEAQKKREMEEKRNRIMKEMDEAKRLFEERMKALESSLKDPQGGAIPAKPPVEKLPVEPKPAAPAIPPPAAATPAAPVPVAETPKPPVAEPTVLVKMEKPPTVPAVEPKPAVPGTNSLGIPFVPVGDVQFAVWPTRLKDFEAFASATGLKSNLWSNPGFKQGPDHPVVNVTWMEAMAFCKWLTFKEQREGTLPAGKIYRLPTDLEWSKAVGLPEETGKSAEARDMGVPDIYPWGTAWPPPQGAGNYTGEETGSDVAIKGFSDGFPWTSPVGSFPPNKYGLHDMGGNVWQWVMDQWNTDASSKVLRGASWYNGALKLSLLSSCRVHAAQDSSTDNYGFRCVIASETPKSAKR